MENGEYVGGKSSPGCGISFGGLAKKKLAAENVPPRSFGKCSPGIQIPYQLTNRGVTEKETFANSARTGCYAMVPSFDRFL